MARDPKIATVPHKIIAGGDPNEIMFEVVKADGTPVLRIMGDGALGLNGNAPAPEGAALTAAVVAAASMTFTDPGGSSDYAFATATTTTPAGFSTVNEANSLLKVVQNLVLRVEQIQARLQAAGIIA